MKQLRWMKTKVGLFGDPKVVAMLSQRHGAVYFVVWFLLRDIAGMVNCSGYACLAEAVPLTSAYIARVIGSCRDVVEKALDFLETMDLIGRDEDGHICLADWDDLQDFDKEEHRRMVTRRRVARFRRRQGMAGDGGSDGTAPDGGDGRTGAYYEQAFGSVTPETAAALAEMEAQWGRDGVCTAIDIARDKDIRGNNIAYIRSVLVNSSGRPRRSGKGEYHGYATVTDYVGVLLQQADDCERGGCERGEEPPAP